jgi:magnesium and cobalt exporter, CNNM family
MTLEILFILLLIIANGILAMSEMAVVSARKARLEERANRGDARARAALDLANAPEEFLSSVQIGITLVGILAGAFGGATIADALAAELDRVPALAAYSHAIAVGVVVVCITFLSLVIGELVPKRLALSNPERIAAAVAVPMRWLSQVTSPVVHLLTSSTDLSLRLLGVRPSTEPPVTEEEIQVLFEQGTRAGVFEEAEQDMVEGVLRLGDRQISTMMTPRTEIVWFDVDDSPEDIRDKIINSAHSRFPVAQGSLDKILGVVQTKDLLTHSLTCQPVDLRSVLQRPLYVPETKPVLDVIELFRETRMHLALVIDEYGGLMGMVTINDILEGIVGNMPTMGEPVEPEAIQREDGSWLLDGLMPVDELTDLLQIVLPEESRGLYQTVGGFVMAQLGRIPSAADHFEWGRFRFEVVDMDGHRVDKVLVAPVPPPSPAAEESETAS